jgi:transcriptional regulator with XRE-family HTH domain
MARRFSGQQLRERRLAAGVEVERLALEIHRSAFTIQAYESGRVHPTADLIGAIADALGCDPGDFFDAEEVPA